MFIGTSQNQILIQDEVTNPLEDKSDKATFLNELGLEECDEENDKVDRWEDCIEGEFEEQSRNFDIIDEVCTLLILEMCFVK